MSNLMKQGGATVLAFSIAAVSALTAFADDRAESLVQCFA